MRSVLLLTTLILLAPLALAADEDSDTRTNVTVPTKRSTIEPRSLPRLAELVMERSPNVAKAANTLKIAKMELENARAVFLPMLDIEAIHGLGDSSPSYKDVSIRSPYTSRLNLVLSENLYDNGANLTRLKIAEVKHERARLDYEYLRDQQLLNMARAYYDWASSVRQREIDENNRDLLRKQYNQLNALYKQGLKTKRDILRIETEVRRLEIDVLRRDNEVDLNYQKLAGTVGMGRDELIKEEIEGEVPKPYSGSEGTPAQLKASQHRRARILEFGHEQAELEAKLAKRDWLPQVFLDGRVGYHNGDYLGTPASWEKSQVVDWSALVTLRYNIWDFGMRRRNVEIAKVRSQNVLDDNRQILLDLDNDLRDIWNQLRETRENVKLSRELLVIEQQSYSILEAEYRNGRASYLDLITNLRSLIDARSRFASSYYDLRKQQMSYSFHKGDLFEVLK